MRHPMLYRLTASVAAAAAGLLVATALPAVAAEGPSPVGTGDLFLEDFSGVADWTALTATIGEWTTADGTVSIDTVGLTSGRYIRPTGALTLPDAYELQTSIRIDELPATATASLLVDMLDPNNFKTKDLAVQLVPGSADQINIQFQAPLAGPNLCAGKTPLELGEWAPLVVRRAGGVTAVWIGGELVASVAAPQSGGTFGLGSYRSAYTLGPVSIDALDAVPSDHPASPAGCNWTEPPVGPDPGTGSGVVSGDGTWIPAAASTSDRPGHEVVAGEATISLDGDWRFTTDPSGDGLADGFTKPETDVSGWDTLPVPGNWDVHDRYGFYQGVGWYRSTFQTGDLDATAGERAWLRFGAVYWEAEVWLNGQRLGGHVGGYTPFEFDVTNHLVDGENTLVVAADNSFSQGAWWSWGGMSGSVELARTHELLIDRQEIVATPDLANGTADITTTVVVRNAGDTDRAVTVTGDITTSDGTAIGAVGLTGTATVPAGGEARIPLTTQLSAGSYALWQLDDPRLYHLDVSLAADGEESHRVSDRFGIRSFVIEGTSMLLNGEKVKLAGANRVSDNPIDGNTEPIDIVRRDMDRMKAAGVDFTRIMHYPQSPELLDYADEIGMLLIVETPVWGNARNLLGDLAQIQHEFSEMVERDINHPSIIAYSVANEVQSNTPNGVLYSQKMAELSRSIDPSRYVTQALHESVVKAISDPEQDGSQFMDFVSINSYSEFAAKVDHIHEMYPDVPIFVSEYSPDGFTFGTGRESVDFRTGAAAVSDVYRTRDFVAGWSQWTYNDYRSDYSGSSPNTVRGWGDADVWGRLKRAYDQIQVANAPVRDLTLSGIAATPDGGLGLVRITPRGTLDGDGPGYVLDGFRLVVRVADGAGQVVGGTMVDLPSIAPGTSTIGVPVSWGDDGEGRTATVSLLSPMGYEVAVSRVGIRLPAAPEIVSTVAADGAVRVRWTDAAGSGEYHIEARTAGGALVAQKDTAEQFADIGGLSNGVAYTVTVQAVSSTGRGAEDAAVVTPQSGGAMAPQLFELAPVPEGLVLGFSDPTSAATFEVEVRDAGGSVVQQYTTTNRPGTRVEGLAPGGAYEVRLRRLAGGEPATVWSEPLRATAAGADDAPLLDVRGTVSGATTAAVVVEPTDGTERYRITVSGPGVDRSFDYERAAVDVIPITGLEPDASYIVTVRAASAAGVSSAWTGTIDTASPVTADLAAPSDLVGDVRGDEVVLTWSPGSDAEVAGYIVTRTWCGETTVSSTVDTELVIGSVGDAGGTYTVQSTYGGVLSDPSEPLILEAAMPCTMVIEIEHTEPRDDGSIPFARSSGWSASSLTAPGGYTSIYADLGVAPGSSATWTAPKVGASRFTVEVALPDSYAAAGATYTVHAADGDHVIPIHQGIERGTWATLGTFDFDDVHPGSVTLTASGGGYLRASAVRFVPDGPTSAPELEMSRSSVTAGEAVRIDVSGLVPGDLVDVELRSEPVLLGEYRADDAGRVQANLTIPASTPAGDHAVTILGAASGAATADLEVLAAIGADLPPWLASTGVGLGVLPWAGLVLLGAALVAFRIRTRTRVHP